MKQIRGLSAWLLFGYVAFLFAALPAALPCWNGFLKPVVGGFITVNQFHLIQYALLGWLAAMYACARGSSRKDIFILALVIAGIGFLDEVVQWVLPQRYFECSDVMLNWAGSILGCLIYLGASWVMRTFSMHSALQNLSGGKKRKLQ